MSDLLATALGLAFAMLVCLLALQAILSPWMRVRRATGQTRRSATYSHSSSDSSSDMDTTVHETATAQSAS